MLILSGVTDVSELKHTPLYKLHLALKAKMVPFAGYQMPVQYPDGIIKEHIHCRSQAGFFDISHMGQCLLSGVHIAEQLDKLVPTNIINLRVGQQRYSVLTTPEGGVIDDIIITRLENNFMLVVNAACMEKDFAYLQGNLDSLVQVLPTQALFALQGPAAKDVMQELCAPACDLFFMQAIETKINNMECIISRSGYCGEDGFEISVTSEDAQQLAELFLGFQQVEPIGLGARDTLRLEAGLSLYGHELNDNISPVEAGLSWLIDKNKHDYPGAKIILQQLQQGAPRQRVALSIAGKIPVRESTKLYTENKQLIGVVTSGSFSPSLNKPIALGLIAGECADNSLYAYVRNKQIALKRTTSPFVPHRYQRA